MNDVSLTHGDLRALVIYAKGRYLTHRRGQSEPSRRSVARLVEAGYVMAVDDDTIEVTQAGNARARELESQ